jgi:hypothetical protein
VTHMHTCPEGTGEDCIRIGEQIGDGKLR